MSWLIAFRDYGFPIVPPLLYLDAYVNKAKKSFHTEPLRLKCC